MPFSTLDKTLPRQPKGYPEAPKTFGEHLLKVRLDRHLSKAALAEQMGVTTMTIAAWEQDKVVPKVMQMKGIVAFLGFYPLLEPTTLAGNIKKYRHVHGLTLEKFGQILGVDGATVWTWENRRYVPTKETIEKIELILNENQ